MMAIMACTAIWETNKFAAQAVDMWQTDAWSILLQHTCMMAKL
jgi:hypothetical protein